MRELTNSVFSPRFMDGIVTNAQARLRDRLTLEGRDEEFEPVQRAVEDTVRRARQRMAAFAGQRVQPAQAARFDGDGRMRLTGWQAGPDDEVDPQPAPPARSTDGMEVLRVEAGSEGTPVSLKKKLLLPPGRYRFEARVRTRAVSGFGACLDAEWARRNQRLDDGQPPVQGLSGTSDWSILRRELTVPARGDWGRRRPGGGGGGADTPREVTLVAELRADAGVAEFDPEGFVLTRL
jgi:hypothetical protein